MAVVVSTTIEAAPEDEVGSEQLQGLCGLPESNSRIQILFKKLKLQLSSSQRDETFNITTGIIVADRRRTVETFNYLSHDPPIEFIFKKITAPGESNSESYLQSIRIGYPGDGYNFKLAVTKGMSATSRSDEQEKLLRVEFKKAGSLYPFDIKPVMSPDEIVRMLKRAYFSEIRKIGSDGTGSIDFSADGPDSPFPLVVWFYQGNVCGIDMKK